MRWMLRIAGSLAVAALLLSVAVLLLPGERIAQVALERIEAATGRAVTVEGDVDIGYFPMLRVRTGALRVANADWSQSGPMLEARGLSIGVETLPLLRGEIRIDALELDRPRVLLERGRDGRVNWTLDGMPADSAAGGPTAIGLDRMRIRDGLVLFLDHVEGVRRSFDGVTAELTVPELAGRADLEMSLIAGDPEEPLRLTASIDGLAAFFEGGAVPVEAELTAAKGRVAFTGRTSPAGDAAGQIVAGLPSAERFARAAGLGGVAPPEGLGRSITASGKMVLKGGTQLSLRQLDLRLDHNALMVDADLDLAAERPAMTARIAAGNLDLSALTAGGDGTAAGQWSSAPIDADALGLLDGRARLTAESIDLGSLRLGASDIAITLDRSRAVFALSQVAAYGGTLGGEFVANNRNGLSVGGSVTMRDVEAKDLLSDLAEVERFSGKASGRIKFLGVGQSPRAIMSSLKGDGAFEMGRGRIAGFDLDKLMRTGEAGGGTTIFDALTAGFTLTGGNMQNDDLKLVLPGIEASGKGRIGIGTRDIDYLLTPVAPRARDGRGVAIPVRIRGLWSNPKVSADMRAAVEINFADEKKALQDKAERAVKKKIEEKLGVPVQDGQSLEDAVRQKAQEKLLEGLGKLVK